MMIMKIRAARWIKREKALETRISNKKIRNLEKELNLIFENKKT